MDHIATEGAGAPFEPGAKPRRHRWKPSDGGAPRYPWKEPKRSARLPGPTDRLVGIPAAAIMLGVSTAYVYESILPQLTSIRLGKRQVIEVAEIDRFIARKRAEAEAAKAGAAGPTPEQIKAAEADGVAAEQIKGLADMVERRMRNTGEARDGARAAIADALRSLAAEAEARKACACAACAAPMESPATSDEAA
jgi:hypothetical protein